MCTLLNTLLYGDIWRWEKVAQFSFFPCLLENYFSSLLTENSLLIKNVSSNSTWLILACKPKLNCRVLRRVSYVVIKQLNK